MSGSSEPEPPAAPEPQVAKPAEKIKRDDEKSPEKLKPEIEKPRKLENEFKNEKLEQDAKDKPEKDEKTAGEDGIAALAAELAA